MKKLLAIMLMTAMLIPAAVIAQPGGMLPDDLNLTDQQAEQMRQISLNMQKAIIPLRAKMAMANLELKELMQSKQIDKKAVLNKCDEISAVKAQIMKKRMAAKVEGPATTTR